MGFFLLVFLQSSVLVVFAFFSNDVIIVPKKVPVEKESKLSRGGANALRAVERVAKQQ